MTILFASNSAADFSGDFIVDATAGRSRSTHVDHGFQCHGVTATEESLIQNNPPAAGDVTWYHAKLWHSGPAGGNNATGRFWCMVYGGNGKLIADFVCGGTGGNQLRVFGTSTVTHAVEGQATPWRSVNSLMDWDMKIDMSGSNIVVEVYRDGVGPYFHVTAVKNGQTNPTTLVWTCYDWLNSTPGGGYLQVISEVIVADEDTRGMGLSNKFTYAAGFHADWDGLVAELSDDDRDTGMTVASNGQKVTRAISTYGGPATTLVRNVSLSLRAGVSGPVGDIRGLARASSTDYVTSAAGVPTVRTTGVTVGWDDDPDSGVSWDTADLTGFEFGVESIA